MKEKDVVLILRAHGWVCGTDEAGDYFCVADIDQGEVQIVPHVGKRVLSAELRTR
ncbi:DUF6990 domain-containing protein [Achromobacter sp.]|uniref:DUF6990 domain-containing protein n=1 Tax=Achromobacter sp. TaxID=134375 RepID=UPI00391B9D53